MPANAYQLCVDDYTGLFFGLERLVHREF